MVLPRVITPSIHVMGELMIALWLVAVKVYTWTAGVSTVYLVTLCSIDGNVYVWRSGKEKPALILRGHSRTVNCVAWDPVHHTTLASASDDGNCWATCSACVQPMSVCVIAGTVRVWGREMVAHRQRQLQASSESSGVMTSDSNQVVHYLHSSNSSVDVCLSIE